ncbi:MAG: SDR family oxidoreductase [Pirellulaceae bacterium]
MNESLVGRRCVVTGASSGIGRASAIALASRGSERDDLGPPERRGPRGNARTTRRARDERTQQHTGACGALSDLSTAEGCRDLIDRVADWSPQIDAWVHCAGADVLTGAAREWSFDQKLDAVANRRSRHDSHRT